MSIFCEKNINVKPSIPLSIKTIKADDLALIVYFFFLRCFKPSQWNFSCISFEYGSNDLMLVKILF